MPKCHVYVRVSHIDQLQGVSLERQAYEGWRYYALKLKDIGIDEGELFEERAISAWKVPLLARKEGARMNDMLQPGDHVVFLRLDRAFRSVRDMSVTCSIWLDKGVNIHFINPGLDMSTAFGKLQANIIAAVVQWESDMKSERLKEAAAYTKAKYPLRPYNGNKGVQRLWLPTARIGGELAFISNQDRFDELLVALRIKSSGDSYSAAARAAEELRRKRMGLKPQRRFDEPTGSHWSKEKVHGFIRRLANYIPLLISYYGDRDEYYLHFTPEAEAKGQINFPPLQRKQ